MLTNALQTVIFNDIKASKGIFWKRFQLLKGRIEMIRRKPDNRITLGEGNSTYSFLPTGDVYNFICDGQMVNLYHGNAKDGSLNNIYLRVYSESSCSAHPLLGVSSGARLYRSGGLLIQTGTVGKIAYRVTFRPVGNIWFWDVQLSGDGCIVDLVYGQDIGVSEPGSILSNELYNSQYLGHSVFDTENGYVVCSRQNMGSTHGYLQQGVLGAKAIHYSTDGLQFFGISSRQTGVPEVLSGNLEDENLQNEFAYTALQTEKMELNGKLELSFYGICVSDHPEAITEREYLGEILRAWNAPREENPEQVSLPPIRVKPEFGSPLSSLLYCENEIAQLFPQRQLEEREGECLLSFFTPDSTHVVTQQKELLVERPHATIVITPPDPEKVNSALISSTQFMYGIFNSHVVVGNTNFHKFISTPRNTLNLLRNNGQRLYVRLNGVYRMFNLPGLYEMGMNYSRWYYKTEDETFLMTAYTMTEGCGLRLEVEALSGKEYDFILTNLVSLAEVEHTRDIVCEEIPDGIRFPMPTREYPELFYELRLPGSSFTLSDDRIFFEDERPTDETLITMSIPGRSSFAVSITGWLDAPSAEEKKEYDSKLDHAQFEPEKAQAKQAYDRLTNGLQLTLPDADGVTEQRLEILNHTTQWYAHNAMIHFAMPHGLEQAGGAAWGTRDICQGPMEFFLTTRHFSLARDVLLNIFVHQRVSTQEWPQWFMFDRYHFDPGECHGDVIFWPLKAVADYLDASGDDSLLWEKIGYEDEPNRKDTVLEHISLALTNIRTTRLIGDTGLITYAGGDWDDTLQPANEPLKRKLVSAWTEALAYQTFCSLSSALQNTVPEMAKDFSALAETVRNAFETYLIRDGVIAGFLHHGDVDKFMLHPCDEETGIHYRLLPMTRSIIAELATPDQAVRNEQIIADVLQCPDGVRLMDHPASYTGGVSHLFIRAEQAANVGREISLQYTHAHIRYIEAMAKLGQAEKAWDGLFVINPMAIQDTVPNAQRRQSNMYFSSSDGAYRDRYEYAEKFDLLKKGAIDVKGGWRLYSSGPGIYTRQMVSSVLGIRFRKDGLVIDPVLPASLNGLELSLECFGRTILFVYHISGSALRVEAEGHTVPAAELSNPYRSGGILLTASALEECGNRLDIYC